MNKAVALINAWGAFDEGHPDSSLDDFCRYYLARREKATKEKPPLGVHLPASPDGKLMRLLGRIFKLHSIYTIAAMEGTGINMVEEFTLLNTVQQLGEPRKTEVVYATLQELSTGTDMLNRLKKLGYITEHNDKEDKRSKRLKVTPKGDKALALCRKRIGQLAEVMFHDISDDDKRLCFELLKSVEAKFTGLWQAHKGKKFEDIYKEIVI